MSESLPSAIQTSNRGYYRRHNSHESFGFEAKSQSSDDIAPNLPLPRDNDLYDYHGYADRPVPHGSKLTNEINLNLPTDPNEAFLSDLAIDDHKNDIDVDYDEPNTTVESRIQDTSFMLEKVVENTPSSQERFYSSVPPSCRPSEYLDHTGFLNDPMQRFIQLLMWNIKSRIQQKEQKASSQPQFYSVIRVMESLYDKLERQIFIPSYTHHNLIRTKPQLRRQCNVYHEKLFHKLAEKESEYVAENNAMFAMETKIASQVHRNRVAGNVIKNLSEEQQNDSKAPNDSNSDYKSGVYFELLNDAINETEGVLSKLLKTIIAADARTVTTLENLESYYAEN